MTAQQLTFFNTVDYINQTGRERPQATSTIKRKAAWLRKKMKELAAQAQQKMNEVSNFVQLSLLKLKPQWWVKYEGITDEEIKASRKWGKRDRACNLTAMSQSYHFHTAAWEALF